MSPSIDDDSLGACPRCKVAIPPSMALIRYQRTDGEAVYAECPNCEEPVNPV